MGTNSAPALANLTLYSDEAMFIDNIEGAQDFQLTGHYAFNLRFIDLSWDFEPPSFEVNELKWNSNKRKKMVQSHFLGCM